MTAGTSGDGLSSAPGAVRQRRYKAHRRGDHTLCLPGHCSRAGEGPESLDESVAPPAPAPARHEVVEERPAAAERAVDMSDPGADEWGPSGRRLWAELVDATPPGSVPLLREACRIADRLDRMEGILNGRRDWIRITTLDLGENVKVRITLDGVLAEARQQATALLALLKELRTVTAVADKGKDKATGGGALADLLDFAAARRRAPAG